MQMRLIDARMSLGSCPGSGPRDSGVENRPALTKRVLEVYSSVLVGIFDALRPCFA
jgi:hypothetical protein